MPVFANDSRWAQGLVPVSVQPRQRTDHISTWRQNTTDDNFRSAVLNTGIGQFLCPMNYVSFIDIYLPRGPLLRMACTSPFIIDYLQAASGPSWPLKHEAQWISVIDVQLYQSQHKFIHSAFKQSGQLAVETRQKPQRVTKLSRNK